VSFLLHQEHGFDQAPLTEITKEEYEEMSARVIKITSIDNLSMSDIDIDDCAGGSCPIR